MLNVFFLFLLVALIKQPEKEIYLIPQGFKGKINVIFNQQTGHIKEYEDGSRVYKIPKTGILLTQFERQDGLTDHKFYYLDSLGKRTELYLLRTDEFENKNSGINPRQIGIYYDGTVGVYGNSDRDDALNYQQFFVSDYKELDSFFSQEYKKEFQNKLIKAIEREF